MTLRLGLGVGALAAVALGLPQAHPATARGIDYRNWTLVTKKPQDMSPTVAALCTIATPQVDSNPHFPRVFRVWVNEKGLKTFLSSGTVRFPDGTLIAKEKFPRAALKDGKLTTDKPELVTFMEKRGGFWKYSATGADGKPAKVDTKKCQNCHEVQRQDDFVFRNYLTGQRVDL